MIINFARVLKTVYGHPIKEKGEAGEFPFTLGSACVAALVYPYPNEQDISGKEKFERHIIAEKIAGSKGEIEFCVEDMALIKRLIAKLYGANILGPVFKLIDGVESKEKETGTKFKK